MRCYANTVRVRFLVCFAAGLNKVLSHKATTLSSREQTPSSDSSIGSQRPLSAFLLSHCRVLTWKAIWNFCRISRHLLQLCLAHRTVNFCEKVLNIQDVGTAITPKAMNISELANARRKEKRQARVLSVQEVCSLESFLSNEKNLIVDRFAAGCFLFALFSRSRWSDLRCVHGYATDILEIERKITGYLEYKTRSHKTARLVQKQGLSMPLVGPVWGVGNTPWVLEFIKLLDTLRNVPLLPAPTEEGRWTNRSTSTLEAKNPLLEEHSSQLGWKSWTECTGKHHSTGKHSHEIYNRDLLTTGIDLATHLHWGLSARCIQIRHDCAAKQGRPFQQFLQSREQ